MCHVKIILKRTQGNHTWPEYPSYHAFWSAANQGSSQELTVQQQERVWTNLTSGETDLRVYSLGTPNDVKVTIMLEELLETDVNWWPMIYSKLRLWMGTNSVATLAISGRRFQLLDRSGDEPIRVFSVNILLYLAEKNSENSFARYC